MKRLKYLGLIALLSLSLSACGEEPAAKSDDSKESKAEIESTVSEESKEEPASEVTIEESVEKSIVESKKENSEEVSEEETTGESTEGPESEPEEEPEDQTENLVKDWVEVEYYKADSEYEHISENRNDDEYDEYGNATMLNGYEYENTYENGKLVKTVTYEQGNAIVEEYSYDEAGNLEYVRGSHTGGHVKWMTGMAYDEENRLIECVSGDYDGEDYVIAEHAVLEYDEDGNCVKHSYEVNGIAVTLYYIYDEDGNKIQEDLEMFPLIYDEDGDVIAADDEADPVREKMSDYTYDEEQGVWVKNSYGEGELIYVTLLNEDGDKLAEYEIVNGEKQLRYEYKYEIDENGYKHVYEHRRREVTDPEDEEDADRYYEKVYMPVYRLPNQTVPDVAIR